MLKRANSSPYRWVIEFLLVLSLSIQALVWLAPAPLLDPIIRELGINLASSGLVISVVGACIAIFSLAGAIIAQRLGALRAMLLGLWLMAAGQTASGFVHSFSALVACRVLEGIAIGLIISPPSTLVMQWFGQREWPYINMIGGLCPYIGMTAAFSITPAIYYAAGSSWSGVMRRYGVVTLAIAAAWTVLGRERKPGEIPAVVAEAGAATEPLLLLEVIRMRNVVYMALASFGAMWAFQMYIGFLPLYYQTYRGLSLGAASSLTAVFPSAGIFGALAVGLATGSIGLRKPFMWPVELFITGVGFVGSIVIGNPFLVRVALVMLGAGSAGSLVANTTLVMELPGMTPELMGSAQALIWSAGFTGAFISPPVGGALADVFGLRAVMLAFLAFQLMEVVFLYLVPETGPRRRAGTASESLAARMGAPVASASAKFD
jgi:MFS family permease